MDVKNRIIYTYLFPSNFIHTYEYNQMNKKWNSRGFNVNLFYEINSPTLIEASIAFIINNITNNITNIYFYFNSFS